jgi:hypothetical protein
MRVTMPAGPEVQMKLTDEEVINAFTYILGRPPESKKTIDFHRNSFKDLPALRRHLFNTQEFQNFYSFSRGRPIKAELDFCQEKIVFIHIPKTAGTTLSAILDSAFSKDAIFPDHFRIGHYPATYIARHRLFHGHYGLQEAQYIPGPKKIFTVLRNPRSRIISQYRYHRARKTDNGKLSGMMLIEKAQLPLKDYLKDREVRTNPSVDNMQTRSLFYFDPQSMIKLGLSPATIGSFRFTQHRQEALEVARDKLRALDAVGLVEQFDDFLPLLQKIINVDLPNTYKREMVTDTLNAVSPEIYRAAEKAEIDVETNALLDELVELDEKLYSDAAKIFSKMRHDLSNQPKVAPNVAPSVAALGTPHPIP